MASPVGTIRNLSQESLAGALKDKVWDMQIDDKWYEIEFTGEVSFEGLIMVKVKKPTKAPGGHR